jgi:hypothetical protein
MKGDDRYPGYLTFDTTNKGHQGLYFNFGSLAGRALETAGGEVAPL